MDGSLTVESIDLYGFGKVIDTAGKDTYPGSREFGPIAFRIIDTNNARKR